MPIKWNVNDQKKINIAEVIKKGRLRKGFSQKELADLMNIRPSLISKWENTNQVPRGDYLIQIANILDIVFDLFPEYKCEEDFGSKMQKEIENLWKAIKKRDKEQEEWKKTAILLEKLHQEA